MKKEWNSIVEMLNYMGELQCKSLVLRNYELFADNSLLNNHEDIDLLCESPSFLIEQMGFFPRASVEDKTHLATYVSDRKIEIDLRYVGDTYYDEQWEKTMLKNRIKSESGFYILCPEDYIYSLLYHGFYHKNILKDEYRDRIISLAKENKIPLDKNDLKGELDRYMRKKGYLDMGYRSK